jgi:hypothetical protein
MTKTNSKLYVEILEWAYNKSEEGFTELDLLTHFNLNGQDKRSWYGNIFRNSGHNNSVLIDQFTTKGEVGYWTLSPKGMSEAINYLGLKEARESGQQAERLAQWSITIGIIVGVVQIFLSFLSL